MISPSRKIIKRERQRRAPQRVSLGFQLAFCVGFLLLVLQVGFSTVDMITEALEGANLQVEVNDE